MPAKASYHSRDHPRHGLSHNMNWGGGCSVRHTGFWGLQGFLGELPFEAVAHFLGAWKQAVFFKALC